jgi:hypothetical protein
VSRHVAARHFTMLSGASESIIQTTNHINHQLNGQTQMLQFIHNQIETLAGRVDRHDALIGSYFPTRDEKRNTLYSNLDQQHTHHSSDMALMQQNSAWPTSLKARNHYQHISETRSRSMSSFLCRCPRPKSETRKTVPRTFAWFWTRDPIHLPGCVFYMHQKMASAFGTSFTVPGRNINRFVDMAWTWGAGPLSYHLTCRNIVSESSPAFQILWKLQSYIAQSRLHDRTYIVKPLTLTLQSLSTLLETNRVGASDVLQYHGYTLYHVSASTLKDSRIILTTDQEAMRAIGSVMTGPNVELTSSWINEVSIFLQTLSAFGVPRNEKDAFGQ